MDFRIIENLIFVHAKFLFFSASIYIPIINRSRNRESVVSVRYSLQMTSSNACM